MKTMVFDDVYEHDDDHDGPQPRPDVAHAYPTSAVPQAPNPPVQQLTEARGVPKTVAIILEGADGIPPTGQTFGYNGRFFLIRPGEEVNVPEGLVDILNDCIVRKPIVDESSGKIIAWRNQPRFPWRRV